jgi:Polyketide cyclase / dehydrase and lipid transport
MNATASGAITDRRTVVIEAAIDIERPAEVVFGYCSDHTREIEWNPAMRRVAKITDGPIGAGTRYEMEFLPGRPMVGECVRFDPPACWTVAGAANGMRLSFSGRVTPVPAGARLGFRMEIETRGLLRAALPLLRRRMPRDLERDITLIKVRLEGRAEPRPSPPEVPAGGSEAALRAVKAIHTLAWFSIEGCMVYVLYARFAGRSDRRAGIAAGVVAAESLIFAGNGFRCPLTQIAERLGAERGSVTDIYLPGWFARNLPAIHVPLIGLAGFLYARNLRARRRN